MLVARVFPASPSLKKPLNFIPNQNYIEKHLRYLHLCYSPFTKHLNIYLLNINILLSIFFFSGFCAFFVFCFALAKSPKIINVETNSWKKSSTLRQILGKNHESLEFFWFQLDHLKKKRNKNRSEKKLWSILS